MFSSRSFIVSGLTLRSLIHFEFIFVYGVRKCSSFILLQVVDQNSQHHLLKRLSLIHCIFLPPLSKIRCPYVRRFISGLSILFHWSILLSLKGQLSSSVLPASGVLSQVFWPHCVKVWVHLTLCEHDPAVPHLRPAPWALPSCSEGRCRLGGMRCHDQNLVSLHTQPEVQTTKC